MVQNLFWNINVSACIMVSDEKLAWLRFMKNNPLKLSVAYFCCLSLSEICYGCCFTKCCLQWKFQTDIYENFVHHWIYKYHDIQKNHLKVKANHDYLHKVINHLPELQQKFCYYKYVRSLFFGCLLMLGIALGVA